MNRIFYKIGQDRFDFGFSIFVFILRPLRILRMNFFSYSLCPVSFFFSSSVNSVLRTLLKQFHQFQFFNFVVGLMAADGPLRGLPKIFQRNALFVFL